MLLAVDKDNILIDTIRISMPKTPWLRILENSYYGHPSDISKRYDISDIVQTIVDTKGGGCFLHLPAQTDLGKIFGDPYAEGDKEMVIYYEVEGWMGHINMNAFGGYLHDKIEIISPVVMPQLIITTAWWGKPIEQILDRIKESEHPFLIREEMFQYCIDIAKDIQLLIDNHGKGKSLVIGLKDNLKEILKLENKYIKKDDDDMEHILFLSYSLRGRIAHYIGLEDPERPGYLSKRLAIISPRYKAGIMHRQLRECRKARFVVPSIQIHQAIYGDLNHPMRQRDAYPALQAMLDEEEGTHLIINGINSPTPDFLFNYFDDPNPNNHGNSMRLFYELKPFSGELKVFSRSNMLTSTIKIGWESLPIVYPEPSDIKQNYANPVLRNIWQKEPSTRYSVSFTPVEYTQKPPEKSQ